MKYNIGLKLMEFSGIIMFSSSSNSWPNKIKEWPLEDSLMIPAGDSILWDWNNVLLNVGFESA